MWLENFKNNGCPQVLKLGASRVTVSKVEKNKAIVMTLFENKSIIEDLIVAAHNNAKSQLKIKTSEEISKTTGGFGIPGFKWPL